MGIDLLHVASEGRMILICDSSSADDILASWQALPEGEGAVQMGVITDEKQQVVMKTLMGGKRLVDVPRGELLPRIC